MFLNVWSSTPVAYERGTEPCTCSRIITRGSGGQWCWWPSYSNVRFSILERKEVWGNTKIQCNEHRNTQLNRIYNNLYPPVINNPVFLKSISLLSPISLPVSEGTTFDIFLTSAYFLFRCRTTCLAHRSWCTDSIEGYETRLSAACWK
jgi:hypothetical protein